LREIEEHPEAVKQGALADRLLLTKADLAAGDEIEQLKRRLVARGRPALDPRVCL
jgi:G3E family GTPase